MVFPLLLLIIEVVLFISNFKSGTFLIGWDNTMPEFDIKTNLVRALTGVWQDYRGLGLYDGMAHTANLIHTMYVGFLSVFLPLHIIRYVGILSLHFLGMLGFYFLFISVTKKRWPAFFGALFYGLNLGVIQQFFTPLEVFAFQFACLPWMMWAGLRFIHAPKKKNLLLFACIILLSTPQGYVPTVFITSLTVFVSLFFADLFIKRSAKHFLILLFVVGAINSFWALPYLVGAKQNAVTIQNARINQYSSETLYIRNKINGGLLQTLQMKGFMLDMTEFDGLKRANIELMKPWNSHRDTLFYQASYGIILSIIAFGIIWSIIKKNKYTGMIFPLFVSFFFLANNTPGIKELNGMLRYLSPLLNEAYRIPFTKFITVFAFSLAFFYSMGLGYIWEIKHKKIIIVLVVLFSSLTLAISYPAVTGNFFSDLVRRKLPQAYLDTMRYFQKEVPVVKRVALLPTHTFWSWQYRTWGHVGSGFWWFGIPQSLMDRAFDPWNEKNEQFYNELSFAIKQENVISFQNVLQKYNVDYLLLDTSLINNLSPKPINYEKTKSFLNTIPALATDKSFGGIIIYKVNGAMGPVYRLTNPVKATPPASFYYEDASYKAYGDYIVDEKNPDIIIPFPSLFTEKQQKDIEFTAEEKKDSLVFRPKKNIFSHLNQEQTYQITLPSPLLTYLIPAVIQLQNNKYVVRIISSSVVVDGLTFQAPAIDISLSPQVVQIPTQFELTESNQKIVLNKPFYLLKDFPNTLKIGNNHGESELLQIRLQNIPVISGTINVPISKNSIFEVHIPKFDSPFSFNGTILKSDFNVIGDRGNVLRSGDSLLLTASNNTAEVVVFRDSLPHQSGYVFFANASWEYGLPLSFYIDNSVEGRSEMEGKIAKEKNVTNIFLLPPTEKYFNGYGVHFVASPIGNQSMKTKLNSLSFYPIPWEILTGLQFKKIWANKEYKNSIVSNKIASYHYQVKSKVEAGVNTLVLSQAYHDGWKAYDAQTQIESMFPFLFGREIKEHVLVNNWANGWLLRPNGATAPEGQNIVIIFWPQYLEFIGFGLLIITFIWILLL